jgi:predicted metal-dependent hydrolase
MIEFSENVWLEVEVKGVKGRLLVREPNALEGARYYGALEKARTRLRAEDADGSAIEALVQLHLSLLTACVSASEGFAQELDKEASPSAREAWLARIPWTDLGRIASDVATVGYPKTSAG